MLNRIRYFIKPGDSPGERGFYFAGEAIGGPLLWCRDRISEWRELGHRLVLLLGFGGALAIGWLTFTDQFLTAVSVVLLVFVVTPIVLGVTLLALILLCCLLIIYLYPALVLGYYETAWFWPLLIFTLLFGWTLVGWLVVYYIAWYYQQRTAAVPPGTEDYDGEFYTIIE